MRKALNIIGAALVFLGVVWFLQGVGALPGSFMTGQLQWAIYGGVAIAAGVVLLLAARRIRDGSGLPPDHSEDSRS